MCRQTSWVRIRVSQATFCFPHVDNSVHFIPRRASPLRKEHAPPPKCIGNLQHKRLVPPRLTSHRNLPPLRMAQTGKGEGQMAVALSRGSGGASSRGRSNLKERLAERGNMLIENGFSSGIYPHFHCSQRFECTVCILWMRQHEHDVTRDICSCIRLFGKCRAVGGLHAGFTSSGQHTGNQRLLGVPVGASGAPCHRCVCVCCMRACVYARAVRYR